ncbi:MAG: RNA ligase family protein [Saprospiraceae bacterium]
MEARKYSRTYHFPFSPGTTSDDRIAQDWGSILQHELVMTEKLDGENTCLKASGVYARSHAAPTVSPWSVKMRELWEYHKNALGDLEVFGESLYAVHSIEYERLDSYYYIFAIRQGDQWLGWDEVVFYAQVLDIPTVPVIKREIFTEETILKNIEKGMENGSRLGGECEGFVFRNAAGFHVDEFANNVLKYVRKNHVKTDEHWTKNWKRAQLWFEKLDNQPASELG